MSVDFGKAEPDRVGCKIARCKISYNQYRCNWPNTPVFSFIERRSKIAILLLQCFLRTPACSVEGDKKYILSDFNGRYTDVANLRYMNKEYIFDRINNMYVPSDIPELFVKYEKLDEEEKIVLFNAINLYCEAIKSRGAKAIALYMICIESIAAYEGMKKGLQNIYKADLIDSLLKDIFICDPIDINSLRELYSVRSSYVHNGIANNDLLEEIFSKLVIDDSQCKIMERIANYTIILWMMKK